MRTIKSLNFEYYYGSEAEQFAFYRIPRVLMTAPHFKKLSSDAKILYGLMLDRMALSMKNGWIDDDNRVYIFFTLEDVQESLSCSHTTGVKIMSELDAGNGIGLIERVRQGQGRPMKIYVKNFNIHEETPDISTENPDFKKMEVKTSRMLKSRLQESGSPDFKNLNTNQTNSNKTNKSYLEYQSIYPDSHSQNQFAPNEMSVIDEMDIYRKIIHENIDYVHLITRHSPDEIDEYVQIMLEAICSRGETIRVGKTEFPTAVVKNRLLALDFTHIEYVLECMSKNTTKVKNIKSYLLSALFNSCVTINSYYRAEVNHDLYGK